MPNLSRRALKGAGGFLLIEVVVAFVLLALFLGPLVGGFLAGTHRAAELQMSVGAANTAGRPVSTLVAWSWGPSLKRVTWRPRPELLVEVAGEGKFADGRVGLWVDGWYVQESTPGEAGSLRFQANMWSARMGHELTVRYRLQGGTWGPPWRTVVPGPDGVVRSSAGAGSGQVGGSGVWVLHSPTASSGIPVLSWLGATPGGDAPGLPVVRGLLPMGCQQASMGVGSQSWSQEEGRQLDVYF